MKEINIIPDNRLPDVKATSSKYYESIYKLYRAGITQGNDSTGTFAPSKYINRAKTAAILVRLLDEDERVDAPEDIVSPNVTIDKLSYSFVNSDGEAGFDYESDGTGIVKKGNYFYYKESIFEIIYGSTKKADEMHTAYSKYGGNCEGMSATAAMFYQYEAELDEDPVSITAFSPLSAATYPVDLKVTNTHTYWTYQDTIEEKKITRAISLRRFIEAMQAAQYVSCVQSEKKAHRVKMVKNAGSGIFTYESSTGAEKLNKIIQAVKNFNITGKNAPLIGIGGGYYEQENGMGHCVLGYRVRGSGSERYIDVYDPNYPNNCNRYITVYGYPNCTGWSYDGYYYNNNKYDYNRIDYVGTESYFKVWEYKGITLENLKYFAKTDEIVYDATKDPEAYAEISNSDVEIEDGNGKIVATIENGVFTSSDDDIIEIGDENDFSAENGGVQLWLPVGDYSIINNSNDEELDVTVADDYQSTDVKTDASEINIHVDDDSKLNSVEIEESGRTFDIDMTSQLTNSCESVEASGIVPKSSVSLQQKNGSVTLTADGVKLNGDAEDIGGDADGDANDVSDEADDGSVVDEDADGENPGKETNPDDDDSMASLLGSSMKLRINGVNIPLSSSKTTVSYKNFYNITFNTNGGSSISKAKAYSNAAFDLSCYKPQKDGYLFAGWYKSSALSGTSLKEIASGRTSNITLYAKWIKGVVGDADGDGVITAADASMMLLVSSGTVTLDDAGKLASDAVTGNNYSDKALRILDYMIGKNDEL